MHENMPTIFDIFKYLFLYPFPLSAMSKFTISKILSGHISPKESFEKPRLKHYIAEHVHPSLFVCFLQKQYKIIYKTI
jgi:hypothetical protein